MIRTIQERVRAAAKRRTHNGRECSSQFKGVSWHGQNDSWRASIHVDGKTHYLGSFHSEVEAAVAYDCAARERFGPEHAWLNFPDPGTGERGRVVNEEQPPARIAA